MAENRTGVIWYGRLDTQPPDLDWGRTNNWKSFATLFTKEWQRLGFQNKKLTKITGGGDYNTDMLGLYNTDILTAITPLTSKI